MNDYKEEVSLDYLYSNFKESLGFCKLISGSKEILLRCPFCGDSFNKNHGHFYIGERSNIFLYNCKKCNSSGLVNPFLLRMLNIRSIDLRIALTNYNKENKHSAQKIEGNSFLLSTKRDFSNYNFYNKDLITRDKFNYFCKRLNEQKIKNTTFINSSKVIFNLNHFLKINNIEITRPFDKKKIEDLNNNYIGFLTYNESKIILRNINDSSPNRFYNLNLSNNILFDFYTIGREIDLLDVFHKGLVIVITEGIFSLLNVYKRENHNYPFKNVVFCAALNKDFFNKVNFLTRKLGVISPLIKIYSDSEVEESFILDQFSDSIYSRIQIYKNNEKSDFGEFPYLPKLVVNEEKKNKTFLSGINNGTFK